MARPSDPAKLDHAAQLYASGKTFKEAAAEVGLSSEAVRLGLKRRGIEARGRRERPGNGRVDPPDRRFVDEYISGASEQALAREYGVGRGTMSRWLTEAGVERRGRSEAQSLRHERTSPEERRHNALAAHKAVRGVKQSELHRQRIAATREKVGYGGRTSAGTDLLEKMLGERQIEHVREKAIGRYNVDIALGAVPVAVEVLGGNWHGAKPIHAQRTPYILDRGWHIVFVWHTKRSQITAGAADYILTFADEASSQPPLVGQYRVIRGDGQLIARGQADDDEFPLVPPTVSNLH